MKPIKDFLVFIIPFCVITMVFFTIYATVQQSIRQGANEEPAQLAYDAAHLLGRDWTATDTIDSVVFEKQVFLNTSLSSFVNIYDRNGNFVAGSGYLNGAPLVVPQGVFAYVADANEDRLTLEPQDGIRIASVIMRAPVLRGSPLEGAYIVAGKSLADAEGRIHKIGFIILVGYAISMLGWAIRLILR
jgi:hypothetical protein